MKRIILTTLALCLCMAGAFAQAPKVVAHRGYWDTPSSAQNSVSSLVKADSIGCYGSEFDVWLTADGKLIVNHDDAIGGHVIETSKAADILCRHLANGENVPTLDAYLKAAEKLSVRLVLEIKPHKTEEHNRKAVRKTLDAVRRHGLESRVDYITFSKAALDELLKRAPKYTPVYYLSGDMSPEELASIGATGADYHIDEFRLRHPDWIEKLHSLGLKVNVWTVNKKEDLQWCIDHKADFITTNAPTLLINMLKQN